MRRITLWLITALLTFGVGARAAAVWVSGMQLKASQPVSPEIDLRWVYINEDLKWESPPKKIVRELRHDYKYSVNERLMVFYPGGQFASVGCTIYRDNKTRNMQLVPNHGFSVYKGTWKRESDGTIIITSRLASSHGLAVRIGAKQAQERVERLRIRKVADDRLASELELNGQVYIPSPSIEGLNSLLSPPKDVR